MVFTAMRCPSGISGSGACLAIAVANGASSGASAATVQTNSGPVLVNTGSGGFEPVSGTTQIGPGAQVMARSGGDADVVQADGSRARVEPGAVVTIADVTVVIGRARVIVSHDIRHLDHDPRSIPWQNRR